MKNSKKTFQGIWTAIITPFDKEGRIDIEAFKNLLLKQKSAAVAGIVVAGTTGESPTLSIQEKLSLLKLAKATVGDSLEIMAGTGGSDTQQSSELSHLAEEAGATSLLVVTPPYNKPNLAGLKAHYTAIAKQSKLPICVYHVPARTGSSLSVDALTQLSELAGVECIKEASGDLGLFGSVTARTPKAVLSGDDPTFLASLAVGGTGLISVISNLYPKACQELYLSYQDQNTDRALSVHQALLPTMEALGADVNPATIKYAMSTKSLCQNAFRLPLVETSAEVKQQLEQALSATDKLLKQLEITE